MAEVEKKVLLKESLSASIAANNDETVKEEIVEEIKTVAKPVSKSKKSPVSKLAETFIKEDLKSVGAYVVHDVVIPAISDTICTMIQETTERIFHGGDSYSSSSSKRGGYTSYNSISSGRRTYNGTISKKEAITLSRNKGEFDNPIFTYRDDALRVRDEMWERIGAYGEVSIATVKRLIGDDSRSYIDRDWGWIDDQVDFMDIRKVREGYLLYLPKAVYLRD